MHAVAWCVVSHAAHSTVHGARCMLVWSTSTWPAAAAMEHQAARVHPRRAFPRRAQNARLRAALQDPMPRGAQKYNGQRDTWRTNHDRWRTTEICDCERRCKTRFLAGHFDLHTRYLRARRYWRYSPGCSCGIRAAVLRAACIAVCGALPPTNAKIGCGTAWYGVRCGTARH